MASIEKHKEKKFGFRVRVLLKITQKKLEMVDWIPKLLKIGNIRRNRTTYEWYVYDQNDLKELFKGLIPFLRVKKEQAVRALLILETKIKTKEDLIAVAKAADVLASLNVRSKNRRKNFYTIV